MELKVTMLDGTAAGSVDLPDAIFGLEARAEHVVASVRGAGKIRVPGRARRAHLLDAPFLGGTAAPGRLAATLLEKGKR